MSTLFVNTIKPDSGSSILISSSLLISESLTVKGDFILSGSIKLGDSNTDSTAFGSDILQGRVLLYTGVPANAVSMLGAPNSLLVEI